MPPFRRCCDSRPPISAIFTAMLGIVLTCIYLWGLLERSDRSVARLGIDSIAATLVYLAGDRSGVRHRLSTHGPTWIVVLRREAGMRASVGVLAGQPE